MRSRSFLVAASTLVSLSVAQLAIQTPPSVTECQPVSLIISGGSAPYFPSILPGGQVSAAALENLPEQAVAGAFTWTADIAAGTSITFQIKDGTGQLAYSAPVVVNKGTSSSCVGQGGSGSGSGSSATGVQSPSSSAAAASSSAAVDSSRSLASATSSSAFVNTSSSAASSTTTTTTTSAAASSTTTAPAPASTTATGTVSSPAPSPTGAAAALHVAVLPLLLGAIVALTA